MTLISTTKVTSTAVGRKESDGGAAAAAAASTKGREKKSWEWERVIADHSFIVFEQGRGDREKDGIQCSLLCSKGRTC